MSVTNKDELLEYGMNEKADVMHLEGDDINDLEDVNVRSLHLPQKSSFYNLRVLSVSKCAELKYLFTVGVATNLSKLEHLRVSSCPNMEELIHIEKRNSGTERITFPKLKFLSFCDLPKLLRFCNDVNVIELPQLMELHLDHLPNFTSIYPNNKLGASVQPFLNKEILIPKLEKLQICRMENLKEIWPCEITTGEDVNICISMLRSIKIERCDSLVNIFPRNPMRFLHYLQELEVKICKSIEMLFNIDLGRGYEIEEFSSSLIRISVERLPKLREVWRVESVNNSNLPILGFQGVESVHIQTCKSFRNLFTPSMANFDLPALVDLEIDGFEHWEDSCLGYDLFDDVFEDNQEQEINVILKQEESLKVDDNMPIVAFSSYMIPTFNHVSKLSLRCYRGVEVVFDIDNACSREVFPCLKDLKLEDMGWMTHVWKCNWNILTGRPAFQNLTSISVSQCRKIKYLLSPLMTPFLSNLKTIFVSNCDGIEEVVSNRDGEILPHYTNSKYLPILDILILENLKSLWNIGDHVTVPLWSLCEHSRKIKIDCCSSLPIVFSSNERHLQYLEELEVRDCESMIQVFEICPQLHNLKKLTIFYCDLLTSIFSLSTLESLEQLKELVIDNCNNIQVIVKEQDVENTITTTSSSSRVLVFPCLKYIRLADLPNLNGFFMGPNDIQWPLLDRVEISGCPKMARFTHGHSFSPMLKYIHTDLGKHSLECGLNFHVTTPMKETPFPNFDSSRSSPTLERIIWSFSNLIEMDLQYRGDLRKIIPFRELQQLQKLQKIKLLNCLGADEIFQVFEAKHDSKFKSCVVVKIPKLREMEFKWLDSLKYIWKVNPWIVLEFPNLIKMSIHECNMLEHVFSCSMVGSLSKLQELHISHCLKLEVIVKEEDNENDTIEVEFCCLKSLTFDGLESMKGFCLGRESFQWPLLDTLGIKTCPTITVFTRGKSVTPSRRGINSRERSLLQWKNGDVLFRVARATLQNFLNSVNKIKLFF